MAITYEPGTGHDEAAAARNGRRETELERADRNLSELVQELRVAQTGVQMLFAFLLIVPFSARFGEVTPFQRTLYFAALLLAGAAAALLIAPAAQHRVLFRQNDKRYILFAANRFAIAGLTALGASMVASLALITDVLYGDAATLAVSIVTVGALALFWYVLPLRRRRAGPD
jgi:hypothetical protein